MSDRPILVVAGARPNFMKVAPIIAELERRRIPNTFVHTGQHYDAKLSGDILTDLGLREPDRSLGIGSGSHADQTARVMQAFEPVLLDVRPSWVVVVGDVNSTLACALVTSKLRYEIDCRIAHVEAGLRSDDWRMPEEVNRVLTDRLADLLLTPSRDAHANLDREGIDPARVKFVGNVMVDTLFANLDRARSLGAPAKHGVRPGEYVLVTIHRPSNVDDPATLRPILEALAEIARTHPVVLPLHPRTQKNLERFGLQSLLEPMIVSPPSGYLDMVALMDGAAVVLTDSGGVQEETTALGVPCVTLREQTERPATVEQGTNRLAPWPLSRTGIVASFQEASSEPRRAPGERCPEGWDGKAAVRITDYLS